MVKYSIERWDAVIAKENDHPVPMIYIKYDENLGKYQDEVMVEIEGTGTVYDNRPIRAILQNSAYFPNLRPNFFNATKYFVLVLMTSWDGYPITGMGTVSIGKDEKVLEEPNIVPKPIPQFLEPYNKKMCNLTSRQIGLLLLLFLVFFCLLLYISGEKRSKIENF